MNSIKEKTGRIWPCDLEAPLPGDPHKIICKKCQKIDDCDCAERDNHFFVCDSCGLE